MSEELELTVDDELDESQLSRPQPTEPAKVTVLIDLSPELVGEIRDACDFLSGPDLRLTIPALAEQAIREKLSSLREAHRGGQPFPHRDHEPGSSEGKSEWIEGLERDLSSGRGAASGLVVETLIEGLSNPDAGVRDWAARSLAGIGPQAASAIGPLTRMLADPNPSLRSEAAWALGRIVRHPDAALNALVDLLSDPEAAVRESASEALGSMGKLATSAVPRLCEVVERDESLSVRFRAISALGKINQPAPGVVGTLIAGLRDHDWMVRSAAAWALGKVGADDPEARKALEQAAHDENVSVRESADLAIADLPIAQDAVRS